MKLGLSTDFGSPAHWERVIAFARDHSVTRVVFWGDYSNTRFAPPLLYPACPALVPESERAATQRIQDRFAHAADLAARAGLEFWYCFQVLQLPDAALARKVRPDLFNDAGEPAMERDAVHQLLRDQIAELIDLAPNLHGLELWVMECAAIRISHLKHQALGLPEIFGRIVETVYTEIQRRGRRLAVDLHTAGGDPVAREGLLAAAQRRRDVLVSGDNVLGDFQLYLPFNPALERAAVSNPIQVHFDLNGEYWGRNFVPTAAFDLYAAHIEQARALGAEYVDGRLSTGHDRWSPHACVLPSRRERLPAVVGLADLSVLPRDLEILATDTLGVMNAEFFCRRVRDRATTPEQVIGATLRREFGDAAAALTPIFRALQDTLGRIFYVDRNYFGAQSVPPPDDRLLGYFAFDAQVAAREGDTFPPPEIQAQCDGARRAAYPGWPLPVGHRCAGVEAMLREKAQAVAEARAMLDEVRRAPLAEPGRSFLLGQFETLLLFARTYDCLFEVLAHRSLQMQGLRRGGLPDAARMAARLEEMRALAATWRQRYHPSWFGGPGVVLEGWLSRLQSGGPSIA